MFWKLLTWGGTAAVILIVAVSLMNTPSTPDTSVSPATEQPANAKKFNF